MDDMPSLYCEFRQIQWGRGGRCVVYAFPLTLGKSRENRRNREYRIRHSWLRVTLYGWRIHFHWTQSTMGNGIGITRRITIEAICSTHSFSSIEELSEHQEDSIIHSDCDDMRDVALPLKETGALGEVPASLQNYIDYQAYGRDLDLSGTFISTNHGILKSSIKSVGTLLLQIFYLQEWLNRLLATWKYMKKMRSYSIWSVEKVLYSINDFRLPFLTFTPNDMVCRDHSLQ